MRVYCTSRNTGPSYEYDSVHMVYLGTSVEEAEKAVGDFSKYQKPDSEFPVNFRNTYCALPYGMEWELIQYYMADGWWYTIVMLELTSQPETKINPKEVNFDECKLGKYYFVNESGTIYEFPD